MPYFYALASVWLMAVNFILLYNRKSAWVNNKAKWYILFLLFILGSVLLFPFKFKNMNIDLVYWGMVMPLIYSLIDLLFKRISLFAYGRDYNLWLRWSSELDDRNITFNPFDRIISITMLYIPIVLGFAPLVFRKYII